MNLEDAQWIAGMQYGTEEVCRIFRVPPTMVGDLRFGSYQNTAELGSQFVRYSLARWIAMWESEIARDVYKRQARMSRRACCLPQACRRHRSQRSIGRPCWQ